LRKAKIARIIAKTSVIMLTMSLNTSMHLSPPLGGGRGLTAATRRQDDYITFQKKLSIATSHKNPVKNFMKFFFTNGLFRGIIIAYAVSRPPDSPTAAGETGEFITR